MIRLFTFNIFLGHEILFYYLETELHALKSLLTNDSLKLKYLCLG
jgi:hypothetical protein